MLEKNVWDIGYVRERCMWEKGVCVRKMWEKDVCCRKKYVRERSMWEEDVCGKLKPIIWATDTSILHWSIRWKRWLENHAHRGLF